MPIDSVLAGQNVREVYVLGDPVAAAAMLSIKQPPNADGVLYDSSVYGPIVGGIGLLLNGSGLFDRARSAPGTTGIPSVNTEGTKATYGYANTAFAPVANATDFLVLTAATKVVRLTRLVVSGISTSGATVDLQLVKRSALDTGGTSTSQAASIFPHDPSDNPTGSTLLLYTANPSGLGTGIVAESEKLNLGVAGVGGRVEWNFTKRNSKALILRTSAQSLALNWNAGTVPGGTSISVILEWTEE